MSTKLWHHRNIMIVKGVDVIGWVNSVEGLSPTKSIKCKREGKEGFGIRDISCFQKFIFSLRSKFICGNAVHFLSILSFNFNQPFVWEMVLNQGLSIYPSSRCFASKKKVFIIVVWYCISQGMKKRKKFGSVLPSDEKPLTLLLQ